MEFWSRFYQTRFMHNHYMVRKHFMGKTRYI